MLKRLSIAAAIFLASTLNAEKKMEPLIASDLFECNVLAGEKITNPLIVKMITALSKKLDPRDAAKMYFDLMKNILMQSFEKIDFKPVVEAKTDEEVMQFLMTTLGKALEPMQSKDVVLQQAIYFSTFENEMVKELTESMAEGTKVLFLGGEKMEKLLQEIKDFSKDKKMEIIAQELNAMCKAMVKAMINSMATVLEKHGFEIKR